MKLFETIMLLSFVTVTFSFSNTQINFTEKEKNWLEKNATIRYSEINWKPLSIIEKNKMIGIMGDFLEIVSKKTGINFKYIPANSWNDVLKKFKNKEIDLVPGIGSSKEETKLGLVSKVYASYPMVIVTTKKYKFLNDLKELKGKTLAIPKYYTSYNFVKDNYPEIKILETNNIPEALFLVQKNKADAFVGHIATSLFYITDNYLKDLKITGKTSFDFKHHYLIQKQMPLLLSIVNKVFDSITYEEKKNIYSKWIQPSIIEKQTDYTLVLAISIIAILIISFLVYKERLLKKSHEELTNIIDTSIDGIVISKNGICINANTSALTILKYKRKEQLLGKSLLSITPQEEKEKLLKALEKETCEPYEINTILADGKIIPLLVKGKNVIINKQKVRVSSFVDLSETKKREALIFQQTKMAAMGEMIGNIAHQWRQPLSLISTSTTGTKILMQLNQISKEEIIKNLDSINNSVQYLSTTIEDFRNFMNPSQNKYEYVSTKELIDSAFKICEAQFIAKEIQIKKHIEEFEFYTIKNELIQVLINILNNSKDALVEKNQDRLIFINIYKQEKEIYIEIYDNAGGIKELVLNRVFDPYFTTKQKSKGTGIGLYMTEEIISKHLNGKISAHNKNFIYKNETYQGACFKIKLTNA